jgi:hypothetical protein
MHANIHACIWIWCEDLGGPDDTYTCASKHTYMHTHMVKRPWSTYVHACKYINTYMQLKGTQPNAHKKTYMYIYMNAVYIYR